MERIRKRLVQLLIQDKIKEINTDVVNKKYVSFVTSEGAAYTFITTEEGGCTYSNNCKGQLFKIVEGLITLKIDLKNFEEFGYIDTYCEDCILTSLEDDNFEQYNNFCI